MGCLCQVFWIPDFLSDTVQSALSQNLSVSFSFFHIKRGYNHPYSYPELLLNLDIKKKDKYKYISKLLILTNQNAMNYMS